MAKAGLHRAHSPYTTAIHLSDTTLILRVLDQVPPLATCSPAQCGIAPNDNYAMLCCQENCRLKIVHQGKVLRRARSAACSSHAGFDGISLATGTREESVSDRPWSSTAPARAEWGANRRYMIAVGGAGSSGLPALASGTRIITNARIASTINPRIVAGCSKITGRGDFPGAGFLKK